MWTCLKCGRIFLKTRQPHSCQKIPLDQHFKSKEKAKGLFGLLFKTIDEEIGKCQVISLPCCIHLFGSYDFLAVLPKKDKLEIRFSLDRKLTGPKVKQVVQLSRCSYKNCVDIKSSNDIDKRVIEWLRESYFLKVKK